MQLCIFRKTYRAITPNRCEGRKGFSLGDETLIRGVRGWRCDVYRIGEIYVPTSKGVWPDLFECNTDAATRMSMLNRQEVEALTDNDTVYIYFLGEKHPNKWHFNAGYYRALFSRSSCDQTIDRSRQE